MKKILYSFVFSFLIFFIGFLFIFPVRASADTFTLSGRVSDSSDNSIIDSAVEVIDSNTNLTIANTTTDSEGLYTALITGGVYNIKITPPAGTSFHELIQSNVLISQNTTLNFILSPYNPTLVHFSGVVRYGDGSPASGIEVLAGGITSTGSNGSFGMDIVPGSYNVTIRKTNSSNSTPAFSTSVGVEINSDYIQDFTLPRRVLIATTVLDKDDNPLGNSPVNLPPYPQMVSVDSFNLFPGHTVTGMTQRWNGSTNSSGVAQIAMFMSSATTAMKIDPPDDLAFYSSTTVSNVVIGSLNIR